MKDHIHRTILRTTLKTEKKNAAEDAEESSDNINRLRCNFLRFVRGERLQKIQISLQWIRSNCKIFMKAKVINFAGSFS